MILPPDETYTAAEAAVELGKSERQVRRYLQDGLLGGTRKSGRWSVTSLDIWKYKGIEQDMLENWRRYCLSLEQQNSPDVNLE